MKAWAEYNAGARPGENAERRAKKRGVATLPQVLKVAC